MDHAERIIARFGGIRPMAAKLGIAVTTVQGWKERGTIPPARHAQILAAAEAEGLALSADELNAGAQSTPTARAEEAAPEIIEPDFVEPPEPAEEIAAEPPPDFEVRTKPARSPARAALLGGLAGVLVAAGAGYAGWTMRGQTPPGVPPELGQRLTAIAKRAADAEARAGAAEKKVAALSGLGKRLAAAEAQARAAETKARAAEEKIALLAKQQSRLEAAGGGDAAQAIAALKSELAGLAARLEATAPGDKLQALGAGLAALKTQVDELAALQASVERETGKLSSALAGLDKRLAAIDGQVAALGKRIAAPARALGRRLSKLEKRQVSASGGRGAALIASIGQLREAVRIGRAFSPELETVTALAGKDPRLTGPLQRLAPRAGKGVPSAADLLARFSRAAPAIVRAGRIPEDGGWAARAWARMRSVVIVRRIGPGVTGESTEAVVARAEARLATGDIVGAAALLKGLKGPAGKAASPWLTAAGAHIEAARAVLALRRAALALIEAPAEKPAGAKPKAAP